MLVTVLMREAGTPALSSSCRRHGVKGLGRIWIKILCWPGGKYAEHSQRLVFGVVVGEPRLAKIDAFATLYRPRGRKYLSPSKMGRSGRRKGPCARYADHHPVGPSEST